MANERSNQGGLPRLTAVPAARSKAAVLKVRFWAILGALFFSAAVGIFAAVSFLTFEPEIVDVEASKPRGLAVAELAAHDFLFGGTLTVPEVQGQNPAPGSAVDVAGPVVWSSFTRSTFPNGVPVESHKYLFHREIREASTTTSTGEVIEGAVTFQLMELTVLVAVPTDVNPVVAAMPHMVPVVYSDLAIKTDYSDSSLVQSLPASAVAQLRAWGESWAKDDSQQLRLLTGDQTANVRYVGLGGYTLAEMRVISALEFGDDSFLVRIRIALRSANGSILEMDMDLTITSASSGLPKVSGWGPAGSGLRTPADVRVSSDQ
jgi:hypothetical protein